MRSRVTICLFVAVLLFGIIMFGRQDAPRQDAPGDFSYWMRIPVDKSWLTKAAQGDPEAQFCLGFTLIRTNLTINKSSIPFLSEVPGIGRRFRTISFSIEDRNLGEDQKAEAFEWIKKSAAQDYAPATEAVKMFPGRVADANRVMEVNRTSGALRKNK